MFELVVLCFRMTREILGPRSLELTNARSHSRLERGTSFMAENTGEINIGSGIPRIGQPDSFPTSKERAGRPPRGGSSRRGGGGFHPGGLPAPGPADRGPDRQQERGRRGAPESANL